MAVEPGYDPNYNPADPRRLAGNLLRGIGPGLNSGVPYYNEMLSGAHEAGRGILRLTTPEGIQSKVSETRQALLSDAAKQSKLLRMKLEGMGGGIGTKQGAEVSGVNDANRQANDLQAHFATSQGQMELFQIISELAKKYPGLDVQAVLSQLFYGGQKPKEPGPDWGGLLQGIGAVAGAF